MNYVLPNGSGGMPWCYSRAKVTQRYYGKCIDRVAVVAPVCVLVIATAVAAAAVAAAAAASVGVLVVAVVITTE